MGNIGNHIIYRTSYSVCGMVSNAKISKLFTRKTCYQNMLCKYIKVFKSCASLTLNRMHVVYWKNNKHQHGVQLQIFPTVETQVIFEVFFSKLCSKFGACNCGSRGLGLGSALAPTILIITSSGVTGDPPKGVKGTLTPLTFKNVQIHLSCLMFNNYGPPKQNGARIAYERRPQRGRLFRWYFRVILMTTYLQYICPSLFHTYIGWAYGLLARHSALWCPSYLLSIIVRRESGKIENVKIATICSDVVLN